MKKAYIRTELIKFYNKLEKTLNRPLVPYTSLRLRTGV